MVTSEIRRDGGESVLDPRAHAAFEMRKGEFLRITDLEGQQVADLACVNRDDTAEKFSVHVTVVNQGNIYVKNL